MEQSPKPKSNLALHYDEAYKRDPEMFGKKPDNAVMEAANKLPAGSRVLELGAGYGRNSIAMAELGLSVLAVDISEEGVSLINKKAQELGLPKLHAEVKEGSKAIVGEFDMITLTYMLHHLSKEDAEALIVEIKKHTKPGGFNAIVAFTSDGDFAKAPDAGSRFYPASGEMREKYYIDWEIIKYTEERREAKAVRPDGSSMFNTAASIIARKPLSHEK